MAAKRLGFGDLYAALNDKGPEKFKNGFLDGTAWPVRPFNSFILPLVTASKAGNEFGAMQNTQCRKTPACSSPYFRRSMSGPSKDGKPSPYFGEYPPDFFDFIVIDECHRGGANDESNWRGIMDYFAPAVQLGLTATPKRQENADTYAYFGEPVYIYSLKEGINDGFLTPFRVKQISTTLDEYVYTPDDKVVEGEVETGKRYTETDFNKIIEIKEREAHRVKLFMELIGQKEKTLVFCATQDHALAVRDLINQMKTGTDPNYCQRVTANDGELQYGGKCVVKLWGREA
jgi:hypothetical protein